MGWAHWVIRALLYPTVRVGGALVLDPQAIMVAGVRGDLQFLSFVPNILQSPMPLTEKTLKDGYLGYSQLDKC